MRQPWTSMLLLMLCLLACEAGFFDQLHQSAKELHVRIHDGAKKALNIPDSTETASEESITTNAPIEQTTETMSNNLVSPKFFIDGSKRCAPDEVFSAGECRPAD